MLKTLLEIYSLFGQELMNLNVIYDTISNR